MCKFFLIVYFFFLSHRWPHKHGEPEFCHNLLNTHVIRRRQLVRSYQHRVFLTWLKNQKPKKKSSIHFYLFVFYRFLSNLLNYIARYFIWVYFRTFSRGQYGFILRQFCYCVKRKLLWITVDFGAESTYILYLER